MVDERPRTSRPPRWFQEEMERTAPRARPLRILILHWDKHPTARDVYRVQFPAMGHEVYWFESEVGEDLGFRVESRPGLETHYFSFPRLTRGPGELARILTNRWTKLRGFLAKWRYVRSVAARVRPDFIQSRDNTTESLLAWSIARSLGIPYAFQLDYWHPEAAIYSAGVQSRLTKKLRLRARSLIALREFFLRRANPFFVISTAMAEHYQRAGIDPARIHVFPVGASSRFEAPLAAKAELRERLGVGDEPIVAYLGSLDPLRRPDQIFSIFRELATRDPRIRFLVVSREYQAAEEFFEKEGLIDRAIRIQSAGHDEVPELLGIADVGLFPLAEDDPFGIIHVASPLKVVEYMACGVVPVSSKNPEAVDLFDACGVGIACEDTVDAFVDATLSVLADRARCTEDGRLAREYVLQYKSCSAIASVVVRCYGDRDDD